MRRLALVSLFLGLGVSACGGSERRGTANPTIGCVPGRSNVCGCAGGGAGAQVCQDDRTYGPCVCSAADGGAIEPDGGIFDGGTNARDGGTTARDGGTTARDGGTPPRDGGVVPPGYDGTYTVVATPATAVCGPISIPFPLSTVTFTTNGNTVTAMAPDPEGSGTQIALQGTSSGASFEVRGTWTDSIAALHTLRLTGTFGIDSFTGVLNDQVDYMGTQVCSLSWDLVGTR